MSQSRWVALPFVAFLLVLAVSVRPAHAVGDAQINVSGQSLNEVQLVLTDPQGNQVTQSDDDRDRAAGYWRWRNLRAGAYTVRVLRNGQQVGQPQRVDVSDGAVSSYRVDAATGVATAVSGLPSRMLDHFAIGLYGGAKSSPITGAVSSSALNANGSGSLDGSWGLFGVEGRYYFNPAQQLAQAWGARLFLYGTYVHYFGSPLERFFLDEHPTNGEDVGAGVDEKWSGILGFGSNFNIAQRLGLGLMLGAHMTRVETIALGNEVGGGGENNRFSRKQFVFGPVLAAELFYPLAVLQGIGTLQWMLRGQVMWMPDTTVDGRSSLNFDYHARAEGGAQWSGLTGLRLQF